MFWLTHKILYVKAIRRNFLDCPTNKISVVFFMSISKYSSFAVIGGDKRQLYAAKSIADDGYSVMLSGFDNVIGTGGLKVTDAVTAALNSRIIILPLPSVKNGSAINAPFSEKPIHFDDKLLSAAEGKIIFCGMKNKLLSAVPALSGEKIYDYFDREELAAKNAVPTAEGAIEIAMRRYDGTINNSRCLVCGYGRIGKVLSQMLKGLGADVTVSARKSSDIAWIEINGYKAVNTSRLKEYSGFDLIFNTVPSMVLDSVVLAHTAQDSIVIDLASSPGGVDFAAARRLQIEAVQALSLPGKVAPKTSGEIIKNTIYNMLEEDNR